MVPITETPLHQPPYPTTEQILSSTGLVKRNSPLSDDETDSSTSHLPQTPQSPNKPTDCITRSVRSSHKPKTRHASTGRVREIPHMKNGETDSNAGHVRETPDPLNGETDSCTGRVRETPLSTNDGKRITCRARLFPSPLPLHDETLDSFQHGVCKRNSPLAQRPDRIQDGVCMRKSPPAEQRDRFQYGTNKRRLSTRRLMK